MRTDDIYGISGKSSSLRSTSFLRSHLFVEQYIELLLARKWYTKDQLSSYVMTSFSQGPKAGCFQGQDGRPSFFALSIAFFSKSFGISGTLPLVCWASAASVAVRMDWFFHSRVNLTGWMRYAIFSFPWAPMTWGGTETLCYDSPNPVGYNYLLVLDS